MKISLDWLNTYLSEPISVDVASETLTSVGLEVEELESFQSVKGGLQGLVVGHVETCVPHPDADRLRVTTVNIGTGEPLQIVCGAPNVAAGQKVIVATVGTTLYAGNESFEIKKSKIRGVESQGMLCAEDEIGVGASHDGIVVLPEHTPIGASVAALYEVANDFSLEINITPNRVDAASHIGSARDIAAYLSIRNQPIHLVKPAIRQLVEVGESPIQLMVQDADGCKRYEGLVIEHIEVGPSPAWLQNRLKAAGIHPINNVVDITNYVMLETGQPLHAFDADAIAGQRVIVRSANAGETLVTLDGVERTLTSEDMVIADAEKPMCIAGVFGGIASGVHATTRRIFLESAWFNAVRVRKTAKRFGLHTDASFRFERGVDPTQTRYALQRAYDLMVELMGAKAVGAITSEYVHEFEPAVVTLPLTQVNAVVGFEIPIAQITRILTALEFEIINFADAVWTLRVPPCKVDVTRPVDVIEEILRIFGYNEIPLSAALRGVFSGKKEAGDRTYRNQVVAALTQNGAYETLTLSLSNSKYLEGLAAFDPERTVLLQNPLSSELNCMRRTMLFSGLEVVAHNLNHKQSDLKLFEFGKTYTYEPVEGKKPREHYQEQEVLALWFTGSSPQTWFAPAQKVNVYTLKGWVESILQTLNVAYKPIEEVAGDELFVHAFGFFGFRDKKNPLVRLGQVHPTIARKMDIKAEVWYAEFNWNLVTEAIPQKASVFTDIPKYPSVRRDLAMLLNQSVTYAQIKALAHKTNQAILKEVQLFDVYQGKNIPEGKKSYALSFRFQHAQKTLTDVEIDEIMTALMTNFEQQLGAEIRKN